LQDEACKVFRGVDSTKHSPIAPECNLQLATSNCIANKTKECNGQSAILRL
jgi:hypothetical protein